MWDWQIGAGSDAAIQPPIGAVLMDVDGWQTSAARVADLKAKGIYTVCYLDIGSWEPGRPDSGDYPAALKIQRDPDWPQEFFLDINNVFTPQSTLAPILVKRLQMCKQKGFDAVEPDNLQNDENVKASVPQRPTTQQQVNFDGWLADQIHAAGLAAFMKNSPDKLLMRDLQGRVIADTFDAVLNEQCQQYGECSQLGAFSSRGKLVLDVEYKAGILLPCGQVPSALFRDLDLVGPGTKSYKRSGC